MRDGAFEMSNWHSAASICGWLSLFCSLPYLTFALAGGRVEFPGRVFKMLLWSLFASPFADSARPGCRYSEKVVACTGGGLAGCAFVRLVGHVSPPI
jgi:hypothetical protein